MNISIKSISIQGWNRIQNAHEITGQKTNHEKNDAAGHIAATLKLSKEGMEKTRNLHEKAEMLEHDYDRMNQGVNKNGYSDIINSIRERLAQINQSTDMRGNKRIEEEYQKALAEIQELLQDQKKVYEEKSEQAKELAEDFSTDQTKILEKLRKFLKPGRMYRAVWMRWQSTEQIA